MDAAMQAEKRLYPECEVEPAGIFYYNVKDPMIQKTLQEDLDELDPEIMKKLKMNGLVSSDPDVIQKLDESAVSLPLSYTTKGALRKGSSVASPQRFRLLNAYVKKKITEVQDSILTGKADASPYEIGNKNACTYCAYQGSCGFDRKIPGYEFRRLKQFADEEVWKNFEQEAE